MQAHPVTLPSYRPVVCQPPLLDKPREEVPCLQRWQFCLSTVIIVVSIVAVNFTYFCHTLNTPRVAKTFPLINKYFGGKPTFNWWDLETQRSEELLEDCEAQLGGMREIGDFKYGSTSAEKGVHLAYRCTKVPGLFEKVPDKLRGVFWMKGNAISEELAVFQMGQWFEEDRTFITPFAPFMWAWAGGVPDQAPYFGQMYDPMKSFVHITSLSMFHVGFSLTFDTCPGTIDLPFPLGIPGSTCAKGSGDIPELTFAHLEAHIGGNLAVVSQADDYTVEEQPGSPLPGSLWHRGIFGGPEWLGRCKCISVGSYTLTKLLDGEGRPVEPHYSEFLAYHSDVPLEFWAGYAGEKLLSLLKEDRFEEATAHQLDAFCGQVAHGQQPDPLEICAQRAAAEMAAAA